MHREFLTARRCGARKKNRFLLALFLCNHIMHRLIVHVCIIIVHLHRIRSVIIHTVCRNPLTKIRLKAIDAHIQKRLQLLSIPFARRRIGKVHDGKSRLPHIPLPYITVGTFQKITSLYALLKQRGLLSHIAVDPDANL